MFSHKVKEFCVFPLSNYNISNEKAQACRIISCGERDWCRCHCCRCHCCRGFQSSTWIMHVRHSWTLSPTWSISGIFCTLKIPERSALQFAAPALFSAQSDGLAAEKHGGICNRREHSGSQNNKHQGFQHFTCQFDSRWFHHGTYAARCRVVRSCCTPRGSTSP